jgi:hypothetical protein
VLPRVAAPTDAATRRGATPDDGQAVVPVSGSFIPEVFRLAIAPPAAPYTPVNGLQHALVLGFGFY